MSFPNFSFDAIAKQSLIILSRYRSKRYAFIVLGDSEVTFLRKGVVTVFCSSLDSILFIYDVAKLK